MKAIFSNLKILKVLFAHLKRWLLVLKPKMKISLMLAFISLVFAFLGKTTIFAFTSLMISLIFIIFLSQSLSKEEEASFRIAIYQNSASMFLYLLSFCLICLALLSLNLIVLLFTSPKFAIIQFISIFTLPLFLGKGGSLK
jgi:hypothetical protein